MRILTIIIRIVLLGVFVHASLIGGEACAEHQEHEGERPAAECLCICHTPAIQDFENQTQTNPLHAGEALIGEDQTAPADGFYAKILQPPKQLS